MRIYSGKGIIDELISNKELQTSNTSFSKKEIDYFNYYLNDFFTNGIALRNKYSYGSVGVATEDEHKNNYMWLCYLTVLFIIKMNEEINYKFDCDK